MLYIYIICVGSYISMPVTIGVYLSNACHHRRIFVHCLSLSAYTCPLPVTIGLYLSIAWYYRRIFVHCLSLSAYICPMPVTISVYFSHVCHYRRIFVQCLSLSAHVCPTPVRNNRKLCNSKCFSMIWNSCPEPSGSWGSEPFATVRDLLNRRRGSGWHEF